MSEHKEDLTGVPEEEIWEIGRLDDKNYDCPDCGHDMCPCHGCHGTGGWWEDGWSFSNDTHYTYKVPCPKCCYDPEDDLH